MLFALPKTLPVGQSAAITVPLGPPPVMTLATKPVTTTMPALPVVNSRLKTTAFTFAQPVARGIVPAVTMDQPPPMKAITAPVPPTSAFTFTQPVTRGTVPAVTMDQPPAMKAIPAPVLPTVTSRASAHTVSNPTTALPVLSASSPTAMKSKTKVAPLPGQMNLAVVGMSRPNPAFLTSREEARMLAGVNITDLRRIVIDKMVVAGGWVTNDFVRDVNGGRVFIVTARTPKDTRSPEKVWTFYFTEVGGRIYGLTTDSAVEHADRMTSEAERLITNLRSNPPAIKK
jgi:hypothetical protein